MQSLLQARHSSRPWKWKMSNTRFPSLRQMHILVMDTNKWANLSHNTPCCKKDMKQQRGQKQRKSELERGSKLTMEKARKGPKCEGRCEGQSEVRTRRCCWGWSIRAESEFNRVLLNLGEWYVDLNLLTLSAILCSILSTLIMTASLHANTFFRVPMRCNSTPSQEPSIPET